MVKCLKPGKVVVILNGKYAGKKAVIVRVNETATDKHKFPHAIVCGVERAPRKVTRAMGEKRINKKLVNEELNRIKNLYNYQSKDYFKTTTSMSRVQENREFSDMIGRARKLMK